MEHILPYPDEACVEVKDPIIDNTTCDQILNSSEQSFQCPLTVAPFPGEPLTRIDSAKNDFARLALPEAQPWLDLLYRFQMMEQPQCLSGQTIFVLMTSAVSGSSLHLARCGLGGHL